MNTFEQKIAETVNKKLNDGTVEKLVEQYIEKGISEALKEVFSWNGEGKKLIEKKLNETIVPVIERHDFNLYLTKLDATLTEIVNATVLADNKRILENFKELMKEPEAKEIKLSDIFKRYCEHVASNVDTGDLESYCDDGEPYYEHVAASMEVEHEDRGRFKSSYDSCIVEFVCEEDDNLNCQVKLYKRIDDGNWKIRGYADSIDINSLRNLSDFEVFLITLKRGFVNIIMDEEEDYDDDIEPEEKPEWSLD
ncbi:hypothetical protein E5329_23830 [Petralouisia muris]|uniref:Uncharacterized protein n=1 Tax=Petralouisia muris TaxID=3032872 RepID=A0AC61RPM0_9FIRM|nr:hypothetical protein [Petralouisia muris]TGY90871.1 hypothetical protein E5329_23830 [Petralouisia muris]